MIKLWNVYTTPKSCLIRCRHHATASLPLNLKKVKVDANCIIKLYNRKIMLITGHSLVKSLTWHKLVNQRILFGKTDISQQPIDSSEPTLSSWLSWVSLHAPSTSFSLHKSLLWLWNRSIQRCLVGHILKSTTTGERLGFAIPLMNTWLTQLSKRRAASHFIPDQCSASVTKKRNLSIRKLSFTSLKKKEKLNLGSRFVFSTWMISFSRRFLHSLLQWLLSL